MNLENRRKDILKRFVKLQDYCYVILAESHPKTLTAGQVWTRLPTGLRSIFTPKSVSNAMGALRKSRVVNFMPTHPRRYYAIIIE